MIKTIYILDEVSASLKTYLNENYETILFNPEAGWNGDVKDRIESLFKLLDSYNNCEIVYIASSMGVFTILPFIHKYPGLVTRVILLDPSHTKWGPAYLEVMDSYELPKTEELENFRSLFNRSNTASITGAKVMKEIDHLGNLDLLVIAAGSDSYAEFLPIVVQEELMTVRQKLLREYMSYTTKGNFVVLESAEHSIVKDYPQEVIKLIEG